jgi:uncharacterized protein (DUF2267 family)
VVTAEVRRQRHESRAGSTYMAFLRELCRLGSLDEETAEAAAVSVLCTLEQRILADEVRQLEAQLPVKLRELLLRCPRHEGAPPARFGREEFLRRVAADLGWDALEVEPIARAVFAAVRAQISAGEVEDVAGQLPRDLVDLWVAG